MITLILRIIRAFLSFIGCTIGDTVSDYRDARDDANFHKGEW